MLRFSETRQHPHDTKKEAAVILRSERPAEAESQPQGPSQTQPEGLLGRGAAEVVKRPSLLALD